MQVKYLAAKHNICTQTWVFNPRDICQIDMQACPLDLLFAGIKKTGRRILHELRMYDRCQFLYDKESVNEQKAFTGNKGKKSIYPRS